MYPLRRPIRWTCIKKYFVKIESVVAYFLSKRAITIGGRTSRDTQKQYYLMLYIDRQNRYIIRNNREHGNIVTRCRGIYFDTSRPSLSVGPNSVGFGRRRRRTGGRKTRYMYGYTMEIDFRYSCR